MRNADDIPPTFTYQLYTIPHLKSEQLPLPPIPQFTQHLRCECNVISKAALSMAFERIAERSPVALVEWLELPITPELQGLTAGSRFRYGRLQSSKFTIQPHQQAIIFGVDHGKTIKAKFSTLTLFTLDGAAVKTICTGDYDRRGTPRTRGGINLGLLTYDVPGTYYIEELIGPEWSTGLPFDLTSTILPRVGLFHLEAGGV
jgi:hypothetical protein